MTSHTPTKITIPATQAQRKFGDVIRRVFSGQEHIVVEKDGLPVVAIISMTEYETFMKEREQREQERAARRKQFEGIARQFGEELERRGISEDDLESVAEDVRRELYNETYGP
jgi:prevent-host-death family protein